MARKRGGIAGFYDRNKGFLKKAVPVGLSFIPGVGIPLAAAAGAAMGADTEGKGYFKGFDVGGAIKGGLEGYGLGKGAQSIAGNVRSLLSPRLAEQAGARGLEAGTRALEGFQVPDLTDYNALSDIGVRQRGIFEGLTGEGGAPLTSRLTTAGVPRMTAAAPRVAAPTARVAAGSVGPLASTPPAATAPGFNRFADLQTINRSIGATPTPNPADVLRNKPGRFGRFAEEFRKNKDLIEMAGKGVQRFLPNPELDIKQQEMDLAQAKFDEEKRLTQMEQERRQRVAQLLMPYLQQNYGQYFGGQ